MPGKKIWAYAQDKRGQYIKTEKHSLKMFFVWEALRLRDNNIHEFNEFIFMSTQNRPEERSEMSVVKGGFYRYKKGENNSPKKDGDSDSLSHAIAIQVLSEMNFIKFFCGKEEINLDVKSIRQDDVKIQLTNRGKFDYYYPDLICLFSSDSDYYVKWGGKLAIEVKHTHECEREKINDFENHGIPIIEVDIKSISIENKFHTKTPTPSQMEEYYLYLSNCFNKKVFGRIISDPVSVDFFNKYEKSFQDSLRKKDFLIEGAKASLSSKSKELEEANEKVKKLGNLVILNRNEVRKKEKYILEIESKGFFYHLAKAFKLSR